MENMGGKMKKILMLIFLLIQTFYYSQDFSNFGEVRINYGNKFIPRKRKYDFKEITNRELVINTERIKFISTYKKDEKIKTDDYEKITKLIDVILKKEKLVECYDIMNYYYGMRGEVPMIELVPINLMINTNGKEYCVVGKNELLEYLNDKYKLEMKWEVEIQM